MKKAIYIAVLLLVIGAMVWRVENRTPSAEPTIPAPTEIVEKYEDEEEKHRKRDAWFDAMHKAAPGVNPSKMDMLFRMENQYTARSKNTETLESFANGKIAGTWSERGCDVQSGRIMYTDYNRQDDILYTLSAGGTVWKQDPTEEWIPLNDHFRLTSGSMIRLLDIDGIQRILVGTSGKHIYHSDDDGQTWDTATGLQNLLSFGNIRKVAVDANSDQTIYALVNEWDYQNWGEIMAIYKSDDGGESFIKITERRVSDYGSINYFDLWSARYDSNFVFAVFKDSCFTLDTSGVQFTGKVNLTGNTSRILLTGTVLGPDSAKLYVHDGEQIYTSMNSGANWSYTSSFVKNAFRNTSFEAGINNANALYFGAVDCYRSFNGGQSFPAVNSWTQYYGNPQYFLHADIPSIQSFLDSSGNEFQIINTDAALYRSNNYLGSVTNIGMLNLNASRLYDTYTNRNNTGIIFAGTQDQGYQRVTSDNGGVLSFTQEISGDYGHIGSGDGGENIWMNYPGFAIFWENAGYSFATNSTWDFNGANHFWLPPLMVDPLDSYTAYLAGGSLTGGGSKIIELTYNGQIIATERSFNFAQSGGGNISAMAVSPLDYNHWYVLTDNGFFYHSSDAGQTWTRRSPFGGPGSHYFYGASIYPSSISLGEVYIGGSGYSNSPVFKTDDHGANFSDISSGLPNTLVYEIVGAVYDSLIFAATELGPYCYVESDQQWYSVMGSAPDQVYWSVDYIESINTIRYGTHGRGIWDFALDGSIVSTVENPMADIRLFPNPASDYLRIESSESVDLEIYDLRGARVFTKKSVTERAVIDVSGWNDGVYIVRMTDLSGAVKNEKILVQ